MIGTLQRELKLIFSDIAIVLTIFGGVVLYSFLYPQPYAKESVSALTVSVVDLDKSKFSRDIIYKLNATPQVDVVRYDMSAKDAKEALTRGLIKAIVVIPAHLQRDITLHISPTIAIGADSSYFLIYGAVLEGAMKSVLTASAKLKVANLLKSGVPIEGAKLEYTPFSLNTINLFNKNNSYTQYVVPAVFVLILQQTLLIGLGILGGGDNERRKKGLYTKEEQRDTWKIFLARFLIFGVIFFVHLLFYFGFSYEMFAITHLAKIEDLLFLGLVFLLAVIALGLAFGAVLSQREIATPIILFSSLPLVFSVGFVWPLEAMPSFIHTLSLFIPSTPAIEAFLKLNQMGASLENVMESVIILLTQAFVYTSLAYYVYKRN